jgi:hypothetical protein
MARFTCHNPHNVYDVIPCDLVASNILVSACALTQVCTSKQNPSGMGTMALLLWIPEHHYQSSFLAELPRARILFNASSGHHRPSSSLRMHPQAVSCFKGFARVLAS